MDYIKEINAFYDHDLVNQLSQSAGYLYLALLNMANRLFWKEGFVVSDVMLMARSGIKDRRTFKRAVRELVSFSLITIQQAGNGSAYTIRGLAYLMPARNAASNAANDAATSAADNAGPSGTLVWNAALVAENQAVLGKNPASSAAMDAGGDSNAAHNYGIFDQAQTKPNQINETKILSANQHDSAIEKELPLTSSGMIAELTGLYRQAPGIVESKGDYSFVGALFNDFGYQKVREAIRELAQAAAASEILKPLPYLRSILKRAGPGSGPGPPSNAKISREEDPLERYERERYRG